MVKDRETAILYNAKTKTIDEIIDTNKEFKTGEQRYFLS